MNRVWMVIVCAALAYAIINGSITNMGGALLETCASTVTLLFSLAASCAFFSGLINIMRSVGWLEALKRFMKPVLRRLFPDAAHDAPSMDAIAANLAANMLGMGNAATPAGIQAMKALHRLPRSGRAVSMFLVINCSSIQLLPSTVIALRMQAGSAAPADIILPGLIATVISTAAGVAALIVMQRLGGERAYGLDIGHIGGGDTAAAAGGDGRRDAKKRPGVRRLR